MPSRKVEIIGAIPRQWYNILPDLPEPLPTNTRTNNPVNRKSTNTSCTLCTLIVSDVSVTSTVGVGGDSTNSSSSEDEGGGEDEENEEGLKHPLLKSLLKRALKMLFSILCIIIGTIFATMILRLIGY